MLGVFRIGIRLNEENKTKKQDGKLKCIYT